MIRTQTQLTEEQVRRVKEIAEREDIEAGTVWMPWIRHDIPLLTSNYVVVDTFAVLQRRYGMTAVCAFHEELLSMVHIVWGEAPLHTQALQQFFTANRRQLSLVDCTSFAVMRAPGLRRVFTSDAHFAEQGFTCLS
ncbi:MAG: VapC toxin family PIN domain ribonuclease [Anaerolineae bacterium]|nr:VapC toxin family PIN domain ribonuclease [Anaerolineae bacterium]